jgi:hypothetical protein
MAFCYSCGADLRKVKSKTARPASDDEIFFQSLIETALGEGWVDIPETWSGYSLLFFPVLHILIKAIAGGTAGANLRKRLVLRRWRNRQGVTLTEEQYRLAQYDVVERRELMNILWGLFTNWPENLIDYCATNRIRLYRLSGRYNPLPFWLWTVINDRMRPPSYGPPREEIESATSYLKKIRNRYRRGPRPYPIEMKLVSDFMGRSPRVRRESKKGAVRRVDKKMQPRPVSEDLWRKVESLINSRLRGQRFEPSVRRKLLDGMLYVLYTGCPWAAMPAKFGSYESARGMYYYWKHIGLFEEVWELCSDLRD